MEQASKKMRILLVYLVLALATFIAFEPLFRNDFVGYDDPFYVTNNSNVNRGITRQSVIWAFTTPHGAIWNPVTTLSHMLDCELFGLNPHWHHFSSLLFHVASTLLLFGVLKRMTGAVWPSVFVAAAFALHPLRVESVAWVAERKGVLSVFFWMLTMWAYARYTERPGIGRYLLVFLFLCLGLMAKPILVTLPFVLLLLDFWPLGRIPLAQRSGQKASLQSKSVGIRCYGISVLRLIAEKIPLFVLVAALSVVAYIVPQRAGALELGERLPLNLCVANALVSYIRYIGKMIYPSALAVLYPHPLNTLPAWQPIVSCVVLAVVSVGIIYAVRRRYLVVGWLWYLGTLVPVIGFIQQGSHAIADRFTYLPSIGIFIMVAWGAAELLAPAASICEAKRRGWYRKIGLGIAAGLLFAVLLICTRMQLRHWKNSLTLYEHTLAVTENNYIIHSNYGNALTEEGRYDEALLHFSRALRINPRYSKARNDIGRVFLKQGEIDEAIACFNEVLRLKPDYHKAHYNLGIALQKQGKLNQAIEKWKKALHLKPDFPNANFNIGLALTHQGNFDDAIKHFNEALRAEPDWPEAHYHLGGVYYRQGRLDLSVEQCIEALRLKPDYLKARITLAHTLVEMGQIRPAVEHYYTVLQIEPDNLYVLKNLAWILATVEDTRLHNPATAVRFAQRACELTSYKQPEALNTLAVAYAAAGRFSEAVATAEKALELAQSLEQKQLTEEIRSCLRLYKAGRPYIESSPKASSD